jgi:hypothetical protein
MRLFTMSLVVAAAFAMTACASKSSSNSSDQSNAAATSAAASSAAATSAAQPGAAATTAAAPGEIPNYPGATTQASGSSSNMGQSASGSVLMTDDSFDKVYAWYQQHMPAGSEKSHVTSPIESAVFTIGNPGSDQTSLTITTQGTKTMITIAHVKS